ncbi:DUF983 domain-containing protein [Alteriqipengyuania sp.]|uniref:DUF983 domain-containing protein n=1 Tax=Alteriqipengyuania sp. TaxID=2800692 RepID=UPI003517F246
MTDDGRKASGLSENTKGQPAFGEAALFGLCPRCGARTLFAGWIAFAPHCRACDLDFVRFNVGDGPAAFLTLIIGAILVGLATWLAVAVAPPWWVHVILWLPLGVGLTLGGLRLAKAALLWSEYRQQAGEAGR